MSDVLINDGVPMWMALNGRSANTRKPKDEKEFLSLLRTKILDDLNRTSSGATTEKISNAVIDLYTDVQELINYARNEYNKDGLDFDEHMEKRMDLLGGFKEQLVLVGEETKQVVYTTTPRKLIEEYGAKHNYPSMVLRRDGNGKPYKVLGAGKEMWDNMMSMDSSNEILKENFNDLLEAVTKDDRADRIQA